ncbi:hypothetical protein BDQ17DRAFT_1434162 [Cyathus striatus]|nr:hypothetical protein BDQ17DRAFT_1434162 [Cyathus striatus]
MENPKFIAVTGATGFIGSHVSTKLLEAGYSVRLLARVGKAEKLRDFLKRLNANTSEVVEITDIATGDLTAALQGVDAIVHTASPLAGAGDNEYMVNSALGGTLNVLETAWKVGIKKIVVTATYGATFNPGDRVKLWSDITISRHDWGEVDKEEVLQGKYNYLEAYIASKILSEKALWKFAEDHPEVDIATINPPFVYGPYVPEFVPTKSSQLGSNRLLYQLLVGEKGRPSPPQFSPFFCDVRDVGTAHVEALKLAPTKEKQEKRFLISGGVVTWKKTVPFLIAERPQWRDRLPLADDSPERTLCKLDVEPSKQLWV